MGLGRALALLLLAGCASSAPVVPLPQADPEAARLAEAWYEEQHAFDALEAYALDHPEQDSAFAIARRRRGDRMETLVYVTEPPQARRTALLIVRERGEAGQVFWTDNAKQIRTFGAGAGPYRNGSALSVGGEVASPPDPARFHFVRLPEEAIQGEPCDVIEGRPLVRMRFLTHLRLHLSRRTRAALRLAYYRDERLDREVLVSPADVKDHGGRWVAERRVVRTADGRVSELRLRNLLLDPELPDALFTQQNLRAQRFPRF
jgi:hypothetical protein